MNGISSVLCIRIDWWHLATEFESAESKRLQRLFRFFSLFLSLFCLIAWTLRKYVIWLSLSGIWLIPSWPYHRAQWRFIGITYTHIWMHDNSMAEWQRNSKNEWWWHIKWPHVSIFVHSIETQTSQTSRFFFLLFCWICNIHVCSAFNIFIDSKNCRQLHNFCWICVHLSMEIMRVCILRE